jgi:hypothetical protein
MSWLLVLKVGPTVRSQAGPTADLMTQVAEQDAIVSTLSFMVSLTQEITTVGSRVTAPFVVL